MSVIDDLIASQAATYFDHMSVDQLIAFVEKNALTRVDAKKWAELGPKIKEAVDREDVRREPIAPFVLRMETYGSR